MRKGVLYLLLIIILFTTCSSDKETFIVWLGAHPTDCFGDGVKECIPIHYGEYEPDKYTETLVDKIEGFTYEEGYTYKLRINEMYLPDQGSIRFQLIEQLVKQKSSEKKNPYFRGEILHRNDKILFSDCTTDEEYPILFRVSYSEFYNFSHEILENISDYPEFIFEFEGILNTNKNKPDDKVYIVTKILHLNYLGLCRPYKVTNKLYTYKENGKTIAFKLNDDYTMQLISCNNKDSIYIKNGTWRRENADNFVFYLNSFHRNRHKNEFIKVVFQSKKDCFDVSKTDINEIENLTFTLS